jgi:hypothetical protein
MLPGKKKQGKSSKKEVERKKVHENKYKNLAGKTKKDNPTDQHKTPPR